MNENRIIDVNEDQIEQKELAPGVILYKEYKKITKDPDIVGIFIWKVHIRTMSVVDFEVHLDQSENIELEGKNNSDLYTINQIMPFETKEVARVLLRAKWKLNSKFKLTMNIPDKDIQYSKIEQEDIELNKSIKEATIAFNDLPIDIMTADDIEREMEKLQKKFIDLEFPPTDDAMIHPRYEENIRDLLDYIVHWRRPNDFALGENLNNFDVREINIFNGNGPEPNDIIQGILPDNQLISALSAIAEKYNLVKRLFITDTYSELGVYQVRLCVNGEWINLTIDDYFPCIPLSYPLVSRSPNNELWVLVLEKALAKVYDSYYTLLNLNISDFLHTLTGCPTFTILIEDLIRNDGLDSLVRKLKQFVSDNKYLVVALSKNNDNEMNENASEVEEDTLTLPSFGYTILDVKSKFKNVLIVLRKVWNDPKKDQKIKIYQDNLVMQNPLLRSEINDYTLLINDFIKEFSALSVCYARNWEEIRIRGKFVSLVEQESKYENVLSKWYYSMFLDKPTQLIISIHQDDDRVKDSNSKKHLIDIGLTILKQDVNTNEISHVESIDYSLASNIQLEVNLPPGNYIVYPRTTGCFFGRPMNKPASGPVWLYNKEERKMNPLLINTIKDIFKKFDMLLQRELRYNEFKGFWECITNSTLNRDEFVTRILSRYPSSSEGISEKGFISLFKDNLVSYGEKKIWSWLENLGYDNELYSLRSRCFMLSFHSDNAISVNVKDAINTDLNAKLNKLIMKNFGEEKIHKTGDNELVSVEYHSKNNNFISIAIFNKSTNNYRFENCKNGKSKIILNIFQIVNSDDFEFFLNIFVLSEEGVKENDNLGYNIIINPV